MNIRYGQPLDRLGGLHEPLGSSWTKTGVPAVAEACLWCGREFPYSDSRSELNCGGLSAPLPDIVHKKALQVIAAGDATVLSGGDNSQLGEMQKYSLSRGYVLYGAFQQW